MASTTTALAEQDVTSTTTPAPAPVKRRTRKYKKRTKFQKVPKMPWPVRALWNAASDEQKEQAHRRCTALLEMWLGKATKTEVMERLQMPALRLWQLSQQGLAGMVEGLLKQPKRQPPVGEVLMPNPENEVKALRRRNAELEKENEEMKLLLSILRE